MASESIVHSAFGLMGYWARSIQPNFPEISVQTQWIGSVQPEKFRKNGPTFWGGPLFPVGPVGILVEWIAPIDSEAIRARGIIAKYQAGTASSPGASFFAW